MNRKGLIAMLDGLLAYTIAFISIGLIALLMMNSQEADIKESYTLNVWVEDLADAVGMSMVNPTSRDTYSQAWRTETDPSIVLTLNQSLEAIASDKGMAIQVTIGSDTITNIKYQSKTVDQMETVVTASRYLLDSDDGGLTIDINNIELMTIKLGI